jgi:hypothetical protein
MNVIAQHIQAIDGKIDDTMSTPTLHQLTMILGQELTTSPNSATQSKPITQTFTLSQLRKRDDWPEWQQSRYKMLDQYQQQGMFSEPLTLPSNANALHML